MRKTKDEALKTREDLLTAALEVFYRQGVGAASLQEIAKEAGVTRGAVYWHFKNKEDLFDALFQEVFGSISRQLQQDIADNTPSMADNLVAATTHYFVNLGTDSRQRKFCYIIHFNCDHSEKNGSIVRLLHRYEKMWSDQLQAAFLLCLRQGGLPEHTDAYQAACYFQAVVIGIADLWLGNPDLFDVTRFGPEAVKAAMESIKGGQAFCRQ